MKNRNYFFIFILTCCSGIICTAEGQNKNRHYVKNRIMTTDDGNSFREKVLYYDNFGKHTETVQVGASPQGKTCTSPSVMIFSTGPSVNRCRCLTEIEIITGMHTIIPDVSTETPL